jgi:hypothetical protein
MSPKILVQFKLFKAEIQITSSKSLVLASQKTHCSSITKAEFSIRHVTP